jgi:DNA repair protein RAD16
MIGIPSATKNGTGKGKGKGKGKGVEGRDSLSSASTSISNAYNEDSGYSTPATSAMATPADQPKSKPSMRMRGRRRPNIAVDVAESSTPAVNAVARAAALRNSQFSLSVAKNKRKRVADSEEDDLDADEDDSPDAQLARALQAQEDAEAAANVMTGMDEGDEEEDLLPVRRTSRKVQKILPKTDYASDFDDEDVKSSRYFKRPKIELSTSASNSVSFTAQQKSKAIMDSDDTDDFMEIDDSDDDLDAPIPMSNPRSRVKTTQTVKVKSSPSQDDFKTPAQPAKHVSRASRPSASNRSSIPKLKRGNTEASTASALTSLDSPPLTDWDLEDSDSFDSDLLDSDPDSEDDVPVASASTSTGPQPPARSRRRARQMINLLEDRLSRRGRQERRRLETHHPELNTMWQALEDLPKIGAVTIEQPKNINRELKPFQLEGVAWMRAMEKTAWGGGLLGDEMGMGKTIQAVSLIMSDWPAKQPSLVLIPPVALMQWQQEIASYTDGTLKTFVYHGTNAQTKGVTVKELSKYNVILMSYNSLESMYRKQEKGFKRKNGIHKEKSLIHQIHFHRVILDEAHNIKVCPDIHFSFEATTNSLLATNHWFRQGMFRLEGRSQVVLVGNPPPEPHRRVLLSGPLPRYSPIRMLFLQAMSLLDS